MRLALTTRGRWLAGWAVAGAIGGVLAGIVELCALAAAAGAVLVAAGVSVRRGRPVVDGRRALEPRRTGPGGTVKVTLTLTNRGGRSSPSAIVRDPFDGGRQEAMLRVGPIAPGASSSGGYRIEVAGRGRYAIGPLRLEVGDPLGLVRSSVEIAPATDLAVHPEVEPLTRLPATTGTERRRSDGSSLPGAAGDEFFALRPYRTGDDLRRVHWAATARTDELIIRQDEVSGRGGLWICLELLAQCWTATALETGLVAAASVAGLGGRAGLELRCTTSGGTDTGWCRPGQVGVLLDALAGAGTHRSAARPGPTPGGSATPVTTVVIVPAGTDGARVARITGPTTRPPIVVVVGGPGPAPAAWHLQRRQAPLSVVLEAGRPVAPAWDVAVSRRGVSGVA